MPRQHRVVDHIVEYLARIDSDYIFGVDGANIEDLYDAAHFSSDITAVLAKHEFSAATMADGYSRSGAGLGVVAATSGGGALNLIPGLGESFARSGAGVGIGGSACDHHGWARQLSGHQWPQRFIECRGILFCGLRLLPAGVDAFRHRLGVARCHSGGTNRWSGSVVAAQGYSAGEDRLSVIVTGPTSSARQHASVIHMRSFVPCAERPGLSQSSPASRWLAMMPGPNSRSCGPCCARRWHAYPTPKM